MTQYPMRILPLILLAASLLLSGCTSGVVSKNPLSSPKFATTDPRLEGLWRAKVGSGYDYFAFGKVSAKGINLFLQFGKPGDLASSNSTNFFVTRTPRHSYLNISNDYERDANADKPSLNQDDYTFLEYHITNRGDLILSWLDPDIFTKAIAAGKLRGNSNSSYPYLTDSSDHILTFIEASDPKKMFFPLSKLTRTGAP